jgi:hypothetical protein
VLGVAEEIEAEARPARTTAIARARIARFINGSSLESSVLEINLLAV